MSVIIALLAIVVALLAVLVAGLLRTNAEVMRALDRLGEGLDGELAGTPRRDAQPGPRARTGRQAADISGATLDGGAQVVRVSGVPHATLLLFLSSGCLTCQDYWTALRGSMGLEVPEGTRVVVVVKDAAQESPSSLTEVAGIGSARPCGAPIVLASAAWADYGVPGSPYAVLVEDGQVVGEGTGTSWEQVANLLAQATADLRWVGGDRPAVRKPRRDTAIDHDTDAELLAAGIRPGDPSLHPPASAGAADDPEPHGDVEAT